MLGEVHGQLRVLRVMVGMVVVVVAGASMAGAAMGAVLQKPSQQRQRTHVPDPRLLGRVRSHQGAQHLQDTVHVIWALGRRTSLHHMHCSCLFKA